MEVISTRRYEARPPADSHASILVDPAKSVATVKEEEWETRKKKEITTTRQIETRVKRQVVLEDGEVVVDSGPLVTTNTTEDVEQQEHTTQERRTSGDEPKKVEWPAAKNGPVVQKELNETIVKSREEIEELLETEDRQHLGDISDEAYLQAVRNNRGDLRVALAESQRQLAGDKGGSPGPRVLQHTTRSNKVVDTEKTLERSELKHTGQIVTERKTTVEHEEIKDEEAPAELSNGRLDEADEAWETRKEATQRYTKCRDEDIVDYVSNGERVAREMRFVSETTEAERTGDWPTDSAASLRNRLHKHGFDRTDAGRKDAVTRKPLDLEEEDEARKFETSKWLESHFGSESRSSRDGSDDEPPVTTSKKRHPPRTKSTTNTSYINVTMKSSVAPQPPQQQQHYRTSASSHPTRPVVNGRGSNSPSQYFHGISEWSERYQSTEKQQQQQQHSHTTRAKSPVYIMESAREREQQSERRVNGHHGPSPDSVEREERRHQQQHQQQLQSTQSAQSTAARNHKETSYSRSYEASRRHQERHSPPHDRPKTDPPSPPLRRKAREQASSAMKERSYREHVDSVERGSSPVHVVQRTWESRTRDERQEEQREQRKPPRQSSVTHHNGHAAASSARSSSSRRRVQHSPERTRPRPRSPPHSRSISPSPPRSHKKDERTRPSKSPSPSKYKIGESFRKLVGKLRSASSERKNGLQGKKSGSSSTSQLTQTDEGSTYLQYNAVDRNVPLGPEYGDGEEPGSGRAPDRPPRSPKNHVTHPTTTLNLTSCNNNNREPSRYSSKFRAGSASPRHDYRDDRLAGSHHQQQPQPIHRYYLGEDPFGGSIYGKEKEYNSKPHSRHRSHRIEYDYSGEPSSLGRFSKSTSRLAYEYGHSENERSSAQTLPRKMHHTSSSASSTNNNNNNNNHTNNNNNSTTNNNNHMNNNNNSNNHYGRHQRRTTTTTTTTNGSSSPLHRLGHNGAGPEPKYGSMINISFRNPLSPKPPAAHYYPAQPPKPERTYKSTLSRSKSFNVEIGEDGVVTNPRQPKTNGYANGHSNGYTNGYSNGYSHNIRSTTHLNKLDETPPLKSPGILASISRSRNDLVRNGRRDY